MAHGPHVSSTERVNAFRERINSLFVLCSEVAAQNGARAEQGMSVQEPFSAQMSTGGTTALPTMKIVSVAVEVLLRPSEISADSRGWYYAKLSVGRVLHGGGRLTSPGCWTDLDNPDDHAWYAGAAADRSKPVDAAMIALWLRHAGPKPLC